MLVDSYDIVGKWKSQILVIIFVFEIFEILSKKIKIYSKEINLWKEPSVEKWMIEIE